MTANAYSLPVKETVAAAWPKVKGAKGTIWAIIAILVLITFPLLKGSEIATNSDKAGLGLLLYSLAMIVQALISWSLLYVGIQRAADLPIRFKMITYSLQLPIILPMIGFYLLRGVVLIIPIIVLIIGMIMVHQDTTLLQLLGIALAIIGIVSTFYLALRMWMGPGLILDKKIRPFRALQLSFKATCGNFWNLVGIILINIIVMLLCGITLGIGLIWGIPFMLITYGEVYKRLTNAQPAV